MSTDTINNLLENHNVAFYGRKCPNLPNFTSNKSAGIVRVILRGKETLPICASNVKIGRYAQLSEIHKEDTDVCFLEGRTLRVLLAGLPPHPSYVLLRVSPSANWLIGLPGLLRRIVLGQVKVEGLFRLPEGNRKSTWMVLRNIRARSTGIHLSLSSEIGIQRFLDYLKENNLDYVILRFFEALPELNREGGDLDVLASDEDEKRIRQYLLANPGRINIDLYSISGLADGKIPYYPPVLGRRILESAIDGPAGSRVPAPKEAFLSLAYHAVYHKGLSSGIPTRIPGMRVESYPDNDYGSILVRMAKQLDMAVEPTLESIEERLGEEGWRPRIDTLAKIGRRNDWVRERFFSKNTNMVSAEEIGLNVFIVKKGAIKLGIERQVVDFLRHEDEMVILGTEVFTPEQVDIATNQLRGGNWVGPDKSSDLLPAMAIVVLDLHIARHAKSGVRQLGHEDRIKQLKARLRNRFDDGDTSFVHSTDNSNEAWEYVDVCFSNSEGIRREVNSLYQGLKSNWLERLKLHILHMPVRLALGMRELYSRTLRLVKHVVVR